jgi:lipoprotein-anchoring transpeptidase ErfK/SrfK
LSRIHFARLVLVLCVCLGVSLFAAPAPATASAYVLPLVDDTVAAEVAVTDTGAEADIVAAGVAAADPANAGVKSIVVRVGQQMLYALQGNTVVFSARVNVRGARGGTFRVQNKIPVANSYVRGWKLPYWMGIYYVGRIQNGIHGPATTRNGTATTSLGCVVLRRSADAAWLFRWASVGTPVTIRR